MEIAAKRWCWGSATSCGPTRASACARSRHCTRSMRFPTRLPCRRRDARPLPLQRDHGGAARPRARRDRFRTGAGHAPRLAQRRSPAWRPQKISPHQTGLNDVLALAQLRGEAPEAITLIGVQPEELRISAEACATASRRALPRRWSLRHPSWRPGAFRLGGANAGAAVDPLNAVALTLDAYESGRPSSDEACRVGDRAGARAHPNIAGRCAPCASASPCRSSASARRPLVRRSRAASSNSTACSSAISRWAPGSSRSKAPPCA